jgi:hypothetical protein
MRENRQSGSEGGAAQTNALSLPLSTGSLSPTVVQFRDSLRHSPHTWVRQHPSLLEALGNRSERPQLWLNRSSRARTHSMKRLT